MSLVDLLQTMNAPRPKSRRQVVANERWRAKNPGKQKGYDAAYRERNREELNERQRERRRAAARARQATVPHGTSVDNRLADNSHMCAYSRCRP